MQRQKDAGKTGMPELRSEREWVLPSHLREKWSLKRFGEVFDDISMVPAAGCGKLLFEENEDEDEEAALAAAPVRELALEEARTEAELALDPAASVAEATLASARPICCLIKSV